MSITRLQQARQMYAMGQRVGRIAFGGGGSYVSGSGAGKYQGGSGAPGSAEAGKSSYSSPSDYNGTGNDPGGYVSKKNPTGTLTGDNYYNAKKEFEYNVDKRKLYRPKDEDHLKNKTIPDANSLYYTGVPKSNIPFFGKFLNMTTPLRNKGLRKNIDYFLGLKSRNPNLKYEDTLEGYKEYMADRLSGSITASGNTIYNTGGNDNTSIPLYAQNTIGENIGDNIGDNEDVAEETTFDYRFGDPNENQADDVTQGYYAANGGRVPRAFGGIMDTATGRKAYGLGSIFKSITKPFKGIAKAAGKVLKSDVGKMALMAGLGYGAYKFGPQLLSGKGFGLGTVKNWGDLVWKGAGQNVNLGRLGMGLMALPFIPGINDAKQDPSLMASRKDSRLIDPLTKKEATPAEMRENIELAKLEAGDDPVKLAALNQKYNNMLFSNLPYENYGTYAQGGRIRAKEGGLMNLGGMEKDYRAEGGFVPIGKAEKADDVPARLSVNEFVFTADAVRNAGGGDIDKGAEVMENMMKNLENGGRVSEESQGNTGAQEMFSVSERIGEVI